MNRTKMNIKMDLLRVAKTAFDIKNDFDIQVSQTFLNQAEKEFNLIEDSEKTLIEDLKKHKKQILDIKDDPLKRIRWGEKILTIASRLSMK